MQPPIEESTILVVCSFLIALERPAREFRNLPLLPQEELVVIVIHASTATWHRRAGGREIMVVCYLLSVRARVQCELKTPNKQLC